MVIWHGWAAELLHILCQKLMSLGHGWGVSPVQPSGRSEKLAIRMCPLVLCGVTTCQWNPKPGNCFCHRAFQSWNRLTSSTGCSLIWTLNFQGEIELLFWLGECFKDLVSL